MIGTRVGHIRITGILGQGGMGEVYRAIDERLDRPVALKVIRQERRMSDDARGRFLREARTLSSLDHPNICRIYEYLEREDGDYLVLELVEGTTLERAIEIGMSRARKLRVAIEVADALAAAHRKGIVHRDLKPENVMLTKDGLVKILDFGIARRDNAGAEPAAEGPAPELLGDSSTLMFRLGGNTPFDQLPAPVTALGIAVGTPAFMSPEQAQGKVATSASDMYAFGLLLHTLFTEREPHPMDLTASELMLRAAAGVTEPMRDQPRNITALVERLKSLAPADRPTAVDALDTLKAIVDAPRRRMRYAALIVLALVIVGAVTRYVIDVTTVRREAERRRRQAEELVSFMVGDLRTKLEAVGRLDVLDGAASRALDYFASLSPDELSGSDLHKNALALAQLGEVRMNQGQLDVALKLFHQSIRFASAAVQREPKKDEWQLALSNAHFWAGEASRSKGDRASALSHFTEYRKIAERLVTAKPNDAKYQAELSYAHGNLGAIHEQGGDLDRALDEYEAAVMLDRARLAREPNQAQWQTDLAISLNRYGALLQMTGGLAEARKVFDEELALRRKLLAASPDDAPRIARLAVTLAYRSALLQMMGDTAQAIESAREELALQTRLASLDPDNVNVRRNRAVSETRLATLLRDDLPRALELSAHALAELRAIVQQDPRPAWRRDLAVTMQRRATLQLLAGDAHEARENVRAALAVLEPMAAADPENPHHARMLCQALLIAADAEEKNGDAATARAYRTRITTLAATAERDPWMTAWRARALAAIGRREEAAALARRLLDIGYRDGDVAALVKPS